MYSAKAFAIRKTIREILVEQYLKEGFGFVNKIEGEKIEDLESWMLDVTRSVQNIADTHKDMEGEVEVMKTIVKSPQT